MIRGRRIQRVAAILSCCLLVQLLGDRAVANSVGEGSGSLDGGGSGGGALTVGLTVSSDGVVSYPASSVQAPSPYFIYTTPYISPTDPVSTLCPVPNATPPIGWILLVFVIDVKTSTIVSTTARCIPINTTAPTATVGVLRAPTIGEVWQRVPIPMPSIGVSPAGEGVTGLPTWLWSAGPDTIAINVQLNGWRVTGTATRTSYSFDPGIGPRKVASGAGSLQHPAATFLYETKGPYTVAVSSTWTATVTMTGPGLPTRTTNIGSATLTNSRPYSVVEIRSVLTG